MLIEHFEIAMFADEKEHNEREKNNMTFRSKSSRSRSREPRRRFDEKVKARSCIICVEKHDTKNCIHLSISRAYVHFDISTKTLIEVHKKMFVNMKKILEKIRNNRKNKSKVYTTKKQSNEESRHEFDFEEVAAIVNDIDKKFSTKV